MSGDVFALAVTFAEFVLGYQTGLNNTGVMYKNGKGRHSKQNQFYSPRFEDMKVPADFKWLVNMFKPSCVVQGSAYKMPRWNMNKVLEKMETLMRNYGMEPFPKENRPGAEPIEEDDDIESIEETTDYDPNEQVEILDEQTLNEINSQMADIPTKKIDLFQEFKNDLMPVTEQDFKRPFANPYLGQNLSAVQIPQSKFVPIEDSSQSQINLDKKFSQLNLGNNSNVAQNNPVMKQNRHEDILNKIKQLEDEIYQLKNNKMKPEFLVNQENQYIRQKAKKVSDNVYHDMQRIKVNQIQHELTNGVKAMVNNTKMITKNPNKKFLLLI
jgi:hypothetical protein